MKTKWSVSTWTSCVTMLFAAIFWLQLGRSKASTSMSNRSNHRCLLKQASQ